MSLHSDAKKIFRAGLQAADPSLETMAALESRRKLWEAAGRVFVVGAGKAGGTMARAAEKVLGKRIAKGCVIVKDGDTAKTKRIVLRAAGHPRPDVRGAAAALEIAAICEEAEAGDVVICLISGGASALMPAPAPPVTLEEKVAVTDLLLACGAEIQEINAVRKHLSRLKGGQLALLARPAKVLGLLLSDVIGDDLDVIGSGPTAPDSSTFADARHVLAKYGLEVPEAVRTRLQGQAEETPKALLGVENILVGSNQKSLEAAAQAAKGLGYKTLILSSTLRGETRDVARVHASIARQIRDHGQPLKPPACIISGGETTVTLRNPSGKGGRNQEFVLAAALEMAGVRDTVILSAGTDGTDGPTDAAGAIADGQTCSVPEAGQRALAENNSYLFFEAHGGLLKTGATGTNVMDLHLILTAK